MTNYSFAQLEGIWLQASNSTKYHTKAWAALMAAIALAESSGNPDAVNPNDNNGRQSSYGLWQISNGTHSPPTPAWSNPLDNARLAIGKLNTQGLSAWGTYVSGAYKKYMQGNAPPANVNVTSDTSSQSQSSGNPLTYTEQSLGASFGWVGKIITGVTGQAATIGDVATSITGVTRGISKFLELFVMLFRPEFWLRVGAFFVGLLALGASLMFLKKAI